MHKYYLNSLLYWSFSMSVKQGGGVGVGVVELLDGKFRMGLRSKEKCDQRKSKGSWKQLGIMNSII